MELTTFGAIMKFAMDLEEQLAGVLERTGANEGLRPFRKLADQMVSECKKNAKIIERTRREGINEVILHPIMGLDSDTYSPQDRPPEQAGAGEFGEYLIDTVDKINRFYTDAASKIANPEAMRVFKRLAAQRLKLREDIDKSMAGLK
jgi:hypothetical protein